MSAADHSNSDRWSQWSTLHVNHGQENCRTYLTADNITARVVEKQVNMIE